MNMCFLYFFPTKIKTLNRSKRVALYQQSKSHFDICKNLLGKERANPIRKTWRVLNELKQTNKI